MSINYYKDKVCINVLAGSKNNAKEIYEAAKGHVVVGVLSSNYDSVESAVLDLEKYHKILEGSLSVGLGAGNPEQWKMVSEISRTVKAHHFNQVFTGVGYNRACVDNDTSIVNVLVSPTGKPGYVNVATGPLSSKASKAVIPVETAILMAKDMGGSSLKFFPMKGLECKEELEAVAKACAKHDFMLEPTGGIDLENFEEIMSIILNAGVKKVIPHIYSSVIDPETSETRIEDVRELMEILERIV